MPTRTVDLHLHTTCSHGRFSPTRVVELAAERGLAAIAITDHNTAAGVPEARRAGEVYGVEVIGGCEFSADWHNLELHVHGLFLDERAPGFWEAMDRTATLWRERLERMMEKVHREGGPRVTWDDLYYTGHVSQVSPVAEAIARKCGNMTTKEAFAAWLYEGRPGFVAPLVDLKWVADVTHDLGGVCVMAHPWAYGDEITPFTETDFRDMAAAGADGLECYHPGHDPERVPEYVALTHALGLAVSGGSDCHGAGPGQPLRMGTLNIPYMVLEELRERRR